MADEQQGFDAIEGMRRNVEWLKTANTRQGRIITGCIVVILLLAVLAATGWWTRPTRQLLAVTPDLRVVPLTPLDQSVLTDDGVRGFASRVTVECLSLHFTTWQQQLLNCRHYFVHDTFTTFEAQLESSGILDAIRNQRLDANVTLSGSAVMVKTWHDNGTLVMEVQVPVTMSYEGTDGNHGAQNFVMDVVIHRVSEEIAPEGVLVTGFVTTQAGAGG